VRHVRLVQAPGLQVRVEVDASVLGDEVVDVLRQVEAEPPEALDEAWKAIARQRGQHARRSIRRASSCSPVDVVLGLLPGRLPAPAAGDAVAALRTALGWPPSCRGSHPPPRTSLETGASVAWISPRYPGYLGVCTPISM